MKTKAEVTVAVKVKTQVKVEITTWTWYGPGEGKVAFQGGLGPNRTVPQAMPATKAPRHRREVWENRLEEPCKHQRAQQDQRAQAPFLPKPLLISLRSQGEHQLAFGSFQDWCCLHVSKCSLMFFWCSLAGFGSEFASVSLLMLPIRSRAKKHST